MTSTPLRLKVGVTSMPSECNGQAAVTEQWLWVWHAAVMEYAFLMSNPWLCFTGLCPSLPLPILYPTCRLP
jgi:hypothetical protein